MMPLTRSAQLEAWARGESLCPSTAGECCPDFSCCEPLMKAWPEALRRRYLLADEATREMMVVAAIGAIFERYRERGLSE